MTMKQGCPLLLCGALACAGAGATDRAIALHPVAATSWEYVTPGTQVLPRRTLGVGFWQRASGAKPGVGANYVTSMEYQLPEAMPTRIRSATFQFSGKQSQCAGGEPVVIDVYAYAGDGRADVADSTAGTRVAQMRADCTTNPAFAQPIDVTAIVRQLSVPAGIRHVGFNVRKANNRQGPGLFALNPGTLTVVVADQAIALGTASPPAQQGAPAPSAQPAQDHAGPNGLIKALGTLARGNGTKSARDQARGEALDGIATLPAAKQAGQ
jgi:hypothetical protein